jgi:hypothetical protein
MKDKLKILMSFSICFQILLNKSIIWLLQLNMKRLEKNLKFFYLEKWGMEKVQQEIN